MGRHRRKTCPASRRRGESAATATGCVASAQGRSTEIPSRTSAAPAALLRYVTAASSVPTRIWFTSRSPAGVSTTTGRFAFAATFCGALRALPAPACATVLLRAGAFAFLALEAAAGLLFAIPASTLRFGGRVL